MIANCPECGKAFDVLWPQLWRYKRGQLYLCSWKCLRSFDGYKGKEGNEMYTKTKKDGTEAKKPGPKPRKADVPKPKAGGDWEKIQAPEANLKLDGAVRIETPERNNVKVVEVPERPVFMDKTMNVKRPQPIYDGFEMSVIRSPETKARYEFAEGCLFVRIGADEVVLEPSAWRKLIDEIPRAAAVLGVEL